MKKRNFLNWGKYIGIALAIFFIGSLTFGKPKVVVPENKLSEQKERITTIQPNTTMQDSIVDFGMRLLGTPYVAAGCGKDGFDCSGFVHYVFQQFKIKVPRSSAGFEHFGKEIPIEKVQKGDVLVFLSPTRNAIGHIGIVSNSKGKDSDFIHASSGREMKVIVTNLSNQGYTRRFVKAIRVL